jgi:hypothetical protein
MNYQDIIYLRNNEEQLLRYKIWKLKILKSSFQKSLSFVVPLSSWS